MDYLPPPHAFAHAFVTAFQTPPRLPDEPWLYQSLGHSIRTIWTRPHLSRTTSW